MEYRYAAVVNKQIDNQQGELTIIFLTTNVDESDVLVINFESILEKLRHPDLMQGLSWLGTFIEIFVSKSVQYGH